MVKKLMNHGILLEWITWDSFEFEKASLISRYLFPTLCTFYARSYYAPFWCDSCNSSNRDTDFASSRGNTDVFGLTLQHPGLILMLT